MLLRLLQRHHLFTRLEEMEARLNTAEVKVLNAVALSEEMFDKAIHAIKRHEKRYKVEGGGPLKGLGPADRRRTGAPPD